MKHYFVGVAHPAPGPEVNKIIEERKPGCVLSRSDLVNLKRYMVGIPITYNHNSTIDQYHATPSGATYKQSKDAFEEIGKTSIKKAVVGYIDSVAQAVGGTIYVLFSIKAMYSENFGYLVKSGLLNGLSLTHTDTNISPSTRLTLPNEVSLVFEPCRPGCHVIMTSPDAAILKSYMRGVETGEYPDVSAHLGQVTSKLPVVMSTDAAAAAATTATIATIATDDHARGVKRSRTAEDIVGEMSDFDKDAMNGFVKGLYDQLDLKATELKAAQKSSDDDRTLFEDSIEVAMSSMGADFCKKMGISPEQLEKLRSNVPGVKDNFGAKVVYACGLRMNAYESELASRGLRDTPAPVPAPAPESVPVGASMFSPGYADRPPVSSASRSLGPAPNQFSAPRAAMFGNQDITPDQFHATIAAAAPQTSMWTPLTQ